MSKIAEARIQLAELNEKLVTQKAAVAEKSASCDALLKTIAEGTKQAQEKKVVNKQYNLVWNRLLYIVVIVCHLNSHLLAY